MENQDLIRCIFLGEIVRNSKTESWPFPSTITNNWDIKCLTNAFGKIFVGLGNGIIQVVGEKRLALNYTLKGGDGLAVVTSLLPFTEGALKMIAVGCADKFVYIRDSYTGFLYKMISDLPRVPRLLRLSTVVSRGARLYLPSNTDLHCFDPHYPDSSIKAPLLAVGNPTAFELVGSEFAVLGTKGLLVFVRLISGSLVAPATPKPDVPAVGALFAQNDQPVRFLLEKDELITSIVVAGSKVYYGVGSGGLDVLDISISERPYTCQWASCRLTFAKRAHLILHLRNDHLRLDDKQQQRRVLRCLWGPCTQWLAFEGKPETEMAHFEDHTSRE